MMRKVLLGGWYLLVIILLIFAFAISVVRTYPSLYQKYLPEIQTNVSSLLGRPVHADSIRIDWHGFTPFISTSNFSIYEDESEYVQLLNVDEATISLDLYKSILKRTFVLKELTLIGSNLDAVRTADEKIVLNGIDISESLAIRKKINPKSEYIINLVDSSISISDEVKNLNYFFDQVDIALGISGEHFKVSSTFSLPETLGESLVIIADIRNLDKGLKSIQGELYSKGKNINLELLDDFFPKLQVGVKKGNSDFQVWGNFNSLSQSSFFGNFSLRDLAYREVEVPLTGVAVGEEITAIDTQFQLTGDANDWHLVLNDLSINTLDHAWSCKQYEFSCMGCEQQTFVLAAALDYINADQLLSTLQHFPFAALRLKEVLNIVELHGELHDSKFIAELNQQKINKYSYQSFLQDTGISIPEYEFSASSITGNVSGDHRQGSINFSSSPINIALNALLNHPLENQNITGVINWQLKNNHKLFALQNILVKSNEMNVKVQGVAQLLNDKPYVDFQIRIPEVQAKTLKQYFPYKRMNSKLSKWLNESIKAGTLRNGELLIYGNPKNFPFNNKPGRFQVYAEIEDGILDYRKDWPIAVDIATNLEINNNNLLLNANKGSILDSSLTNVRAEIKDLKLPILAIDGNAAGPANNLLQYLQQSSLLPKDSKVIKHIKASGKSNLDLNIVLTLTKKLEKQRLVSGVIEFNDTTLNVNALSLPFTNLNGKLRFDKNGAEGQGLTAKLYDETISVSAKKINAGRTKLFLSGDLDLDSYFATNYTKLHKYLKGMAPATVEIDIPRFSKKDTNKKLNIKINSDLYGAQILLPEPFKKEINSERQLAIHTKHQQGFDSEIYASLNNQVFMQTILDKDTSELSAMEVRIGNEQFILPQFGIKVSGRLKHLDLAQWLELINSEQENEIALNEIDLYVNQVELGNLIIDNVDFYTKKNTHFWVGDIISSVAKGQFEYPVDADSGSVATANFDYLRFNSTGDKSKSDSTNFDPKSLPALVVNAKQFKYRDAELTDVSLKTKPSVNGLSIDSLQGNGKDLRVSANGSWEITDDNSQTTKLTITLLTENLQNSLVGLGFDSAVIGGEGQVTADFTWPKAPYQFSLAAVKGNTNLRFNDGAISSVEPGGAGRLIGLVNLSEISRRLSLDFTDFFSKGYSFEKIRGDLMFKDANLTTENLRIRGPSADIIIQGRTGIAVKDYDQIVTVTPHVSGGLPWIGLAVGGPLGAVGVIVGEKIAKSIGVDVDKVTQVQYRMTGSWDDPKVEAIAREVAENNSSTQQGQPSPENPPQTSQQRTPSAQPPQSQLNSNHASP